MPPPTFRDLRRAILPVACAAAALASAVRAADLPIPAVARAEPRPVAVRVQWGGGTPQAWSGEIAVVAPATGNAADWRTLCTDPDAASMVRDDGGSIVVAETRPVVGAGVEVIVPDVDGRLRVRLAPADGRRRPVSIDVAVAELVTAPVQQSLDGEGNRLSVRLTAGETLRVIQEAVVAGARSVHRPGDRVRFRVDPLLAVKPEHAGAIELRLRLRSAAGGDEHDTQTTAVSPRAAVAAAAADGRVATRCAPVVFEVTLPPQEGVCDVEIEAVERGGLRWARPLASRTVQVVALDAVPRGPAPPAEWKLVHEVDPGSPRLHERLRRLPAVGLPKMPLPALPLPNMPLPSLTRPNGPLRKLPNVSLQQVSSMVPKLSGLLASGHSMVEVHQAGPMLRLPAAPTAGGAAWEGVLVANVQPGLPHLVEIEYPTDQDAAVGVSVLELDATGGLVETRHAGGFEIRRETCDTGAARLEVHRLVFWPTTRNPLVLLANPSPRSHALIGRVRVFAGPSRPPAATASTLSSVIGASARPRTLHGFMPTPDFGAWGGGERLDRDSGRAFADWGTHLAAVRHSAEQLAARGAAGAMVAVHARGAALWPSSLTRHAPRWGAGTTAEPGLDSAPKDLLELLCRVYASERLRLVPALTFDAAVPDLETLVARGGADAQGVVCVGRDGRGRSLSGGGPHYNILDPRVQRAVAVIVEELAARLRGAEAVDGIALLMPHDGWLHLPGASWPLDDVTFGRFFAAVDGQDVPAGPARFAARADLVEGPLREAWLSWRAREMAAFHGRLAAILAAQDPRWTLHVVPTTLLTAGDLAARFRPTLAPAPPVADVLREVGLDPDRVGDHPQVVLAVPHVHSAAESLAVRGAVAAANRTVASAAGRAARRSMVIVEEPAEFDVADVVPHGPFANAAPAGPCRMHALPQAMGRDRGYAEVFAGGDPEVVFDMRMGLESPAVASPARRSVEALPAVGLLDSAAGTGGPLMVRARRIGTLTWVHVVNATGAPGRILLSLAGQPSAVLDAVEQTQLSLGGDGVATVPVGAWGMRSLIVDGHATVRGARLEIDDAARGVVAARIESLHRRRAVLETPSPLDVLDNPDFEIGAARDGESPVSGWELLEPRRGGLALVPVAASPERGPSGGRALAFSSVNGLATLRSNPFAGPVTGRLSVAAWLRLPEGEPQPPLRLALEGVQGDREYYRFAAVGGLAGGRPLTGEWALFVLQVDDLPAVGVESLRVRFDLLGPGTVQIDEIRVFDLAFDETQRVALSRIVAEFDRMLAVGDAAGCAAGLDGHWPRFLETFVADAPPERVATAPEALPAVPPARPSGMFDRLRSWWQ